MFAQWEIFEKGCKIFGINHNQMTIGEDSSMKKPWSWSTEMKAKIKNEITISGALNPPLSHTKNTNKNMNTLMFYSQLILSNKAHNQFL